MIDPKYRLIDEKGSLNSRTVTKPRSKLVFAGALAAALVLAILYFPLLWESATVSATPLATSVTGVPSSRPFLEGESSLLDDQEELANLYALVAPSVVNIQVSTKATAVFSQFDTPNGEPPLQQSQGSGFIFDSSGHIVTNNHVVEDAESVLVVFSNGYWADAEVVAADPQADLAVIKVVPPEGMDWRPLPLDESDTLPRWPYGDCNR